LAFVVSS